MTQLNNRFRNSPRAGATGGFTLIEVMIVVTIIGILLAVTLPGYQETLRKGRRADAKSALLDVANRQEQFMLDQNTYTLDMTDLGYAADPRVSEEGFYTIDAAACAGGAINRCYLLTATPVTGGAQAGDTRCVLFRLDSSGAKTATGSEADICWQR